MTQPDDVTPQFAPRPATTEEANAFGDYGPDHTLANDGTGPQTQTKKDSKRKSPLSNLGQNKKPRSGVRQLQEKDRDKISQLYVTAGMCAMPFKPDIASSLASIADDCADAWFDLAKENDAVRRTILMLIEGGAWGKVLAAHLPLILTMLPNETKQATGIDFDSMLRSMTENNGGENSDEL